MISSNNKQIQDFSNATGIRHNPSFALIVAFDYYDGPERGLAIYPSGEGVRFTSLGDSHTRLFRSFELTAIEGNWWVQVNAIPEAAKNKQSGQVLVPAQASEVLELLERSVLEALPTGYHVAVGSPSLEWLMVSSVTFDHLTALRQLSCLKSGFHEVHQVVKSNRKK
jgi:hypothetical protein